MIHRRKHQRWLVGGHILLMLGAVAVVISVTLSRVRVGLSANRSRSH